MMLNSSWIHIPSEAKVQKLRLGQDQLIVGQAHAEATHQIAMFFDQGLFEDTQCHQTRILEAGQVFVEAPGCDIYLTKVGSCSEPVTFNQLVKKKAWIRVRG